MSGQLKRGAKPVMWSPVEQTALAEAEIEYGRPQGADDLGEVSGASRRDSRSEADLAPESCLVVIWTTTPWTIPANRAVSFNPEISYGVYAVTEAPVDNWAKAGDKLIVCRQARRDVMKAAKVGKLRASAMSARRSCRRDAAASAACLGLFDFDVPMLAGAHVTDDTGTGFVHTAPSHGEDDYEVWMANAKALEARGIDVTIPNTVDAVGATPMSPRLRGRAHARRQGRQGRRTRR